MMAACAVSPAGVEFEAVDGEPAYLFILLVSPESVGTPHVKVLANISRLLKESRCAGACARPTAPWRTCRR